MDRVRIENKEDRYGSHNGPERVTARDARGLPWSLYAAEVLIAKAWLSWFYEPARRSRRAYELKPACERAMAHYIGTRALAAAARQLGWRVRELPNFDFAIFCRPKRPAPRAPKVLPRGAQGEGAQRREIDLVNRPKLFGQRIGAAS